MYQQTEQVKQAISADSRTFKAKIIVGQDEVATGFRSILVTRKSNNEDRIGLGGTVSATLEVSVVSPEISLENQELELQFGVETDEGVVYESIGLFTVQRPRDDDGLVNFTAYDRMASKLSKAYFSELSYPIDSRYALQEISAKSGVPLGNLDMLPAGIMIQKRRVVRESTYDEEGNEIENVQYVNPFDGYTYREALGYIAQLHGKFATIDRDGSIMLKWYTEVDYVVTPSRYFDDLVKNELAYDIGTIECTVGEDTLTAGSGTIGMQIENPVMTQDRLNALYASLSDFHFLPASVSFLGDTCLELGDIITVNDKYGNTIKIPIMSLVLDFDGGLITTIESFGRTEAETDSGTRGPTAQAIDRVYAELFLVMEIMGNKASFDDLNAVNASFKNMKSDYGEFKELTAEKLTAVDAEFESLSAKYATVDLANIEAGAIKTAMIDVGAIQTAQIADGAITNLKVAGDLDATKITVGTLSVDRLVIRGSTKSLVYELNNITGALQSKSVETLNGEILTPRTITADKVVANSITGNEIAAKTITSNNIAANTITASNIKTGTITANKIDVDDLFAQNITATGKIEGANLTGATVDASVLYAKSSIKMYTTAFSSAIDVLSIPASEEDIDYLQIGNSGLSNVRFVNPINSPSMYSDGEISCKQLILNGIDIGSKLSKWAMVSNIKVSKTTETIAPNGTTTVTLDFKSQIKSTSSLFLAIEVTAGWLQVMSHTISGTSITVNLVNASAASHTASVIANILEFQAIIT